MKQNSKNTWKPFITLRVTLYGLHFLQQFVPARGETRQRQYILDLQADFHSPLDHLKDCIVPEEIVPVAMRNDDQEKVSKFIGKSRSYIANCLRLLSLPDIVIKFIEDKKLTPGHAKILVGLDNAVFVANKIIKKRLHGSYYL